MNRFRCLTVALLLLAAAPSARGAAPQTGHASLGGTSGLINTPTADVLSDATFRFGYFRIDKKWAYQLRGVSDNDVYFVSFGFLPRVELTVRATVFKDVTLLPNTDFPQVDRMGSARILVLPEGRAPAVAVGLDDPRGTRRFHSLYVVGTKTVPMPLGQMTLRASGGYGFPAFSAARRVLDGAFGGVELGFPGRVTGTLEYDSEKWNTDVCLVFLGRLSVHAALLHLDTLSGGAAWAQPF
jgi:hypothetical protein